MKKYLLIFLILVSCTPQKRLTRFISRHPELVKTDTSFTKVVLRDTVRIQGTEIDTFFMSMYSDTSRGTKTVLNFKKDSISVKITQSGKRYNVNVNSPAYIIPINKEIRIPLVNKSIIMQPVMKNTFLKYMSLGCIVIFFCFLFRWVSIKCKL